MSMKEWTDLFPCRKIKGKRAAARGRSACDMATGGALLEPVIASEKGWVGYAAD